MSYNTSTGAVSAQRYTPYGAPRGPASTLPTDYQFTGQRSEEAGLGSLYDYNARHYSPVLGRFLSPDTIVPSPGDPQSLNRYAYVLNNPLRYTDPTGHDVACPGQDASQCYGGLFEYWASIFDQSRLDAEIRQWLIDNQDMATIIAVGAILEELYGETNALVPQAYATIYATSFVGGDLPGLTEDKYAPLLAGVILAGIGLTDAHIYNPQEARTGTAPTVGQKVYRVFGNRAKAYGRSWTPVDPRTVPDYADAAGLPAGNSGKYLSEGVLIDIQGVQVRSALKVDSKYGLRSGGLPEYVIPNPKQQIGNIVTHRLPGGLGKR